MIPRNRVFDPTEVGIYHLCSRCVRQLFLLGFDGLTQQQNRHRRKRMIRFLRRLVKHMAVDVLDFALMENHVHCIVRNRPDLVAGWSDREVAERWWNLCPKKKDRHGRARKPTHQDLASWLNDPDKMTKLRWRLSSISWLMWFWMHKIACFANREDGKKGHFVEGRFRAQRLEDEGAVLACSIYVALNAQRAGMVEQAEDHIDSSYYRRVVSHMKRSQRLLGTTPQTQERLDTDSWIAQFFLDERSEAYDSTMQEVDGQRRLTPQGNPHGAPRVSDKGYLPISWEKYVEILEWTAENVTPESAKKSAMPRRVRAQLEQCGIEPELWLDTVQRWDELFHYMIGTEDQLQALAEHYGQQHYQGVRECRRRFGQPRGEDARGEDARPDASDRDDLPPRG